MERKKVLITGNGDNRENLTGREGIICGGNEHGHTVYTSYYSDLFPFGANYFFLPFTDVKLIEEPKPATT